MTNNDKTTDYVRLTTTEGEDGTAQRIMLTALDGYAFDLAGELSTTITARVVAIPPAQPIPGRSYMLDGKHVLVGKIDRDEQGKAIAVYDEHTGEKHLWPAKPANRI